MKIGVYSIFIGVCIQIFLLAIAIAQVDAHAPGASLAWTPESVLITIGCAVITILVAIVGWLGKNQLDTILKTMETFMSKQITCRDELCSRFADKDSVQRNIKELYERTDRHESIIQRHCVIIGGRRSGDEE